MNKIILPIGCVFLTLMSSGGFAGTTVSQKLAEDPSQTPYQVLKDLFDKAASPVSLSEITDESISKVPYDCEAAHADSPVPFSIQLRGHAYATQYRGPLFPSKTGTVMAAFVSGTANVFGEPDDCALAKVTISPTEIAQEGLTSNVLSTSLKIKKNGELLVFENYDSSYITSITSYGYCFKN